MTDSEKSAGQHDSIHMFNIKNLSFFLTSNTQSELYPRLFIMTRHGKLVAYSSPFDIAQIQAEAALVAMSWKKNTENIPSKSPLSTLMIEAGDYSVVASPIHPNLLLVLVGIKSHDGTSAFKITPITADNVDKDGSNANLENDVAALTSRGYADSHLAALTLQRRKAERLAKTVEEESRFLHVPDDSYYD